MPRGKIDAYELGQGGVNVNADPTKIKPDEARQLQNAQLDTDASKGALRKRGGMPRHNSSTLGGSITGAVNVPLPNPDKVTRTYYASMGTAAANTWATSSDGITWTAGTTPSVRAQTQAKRDFATTNLPISAVHLPNGFQRKLWYPSDDYTVGTSDPKIRFYDGTDQFDLSAIPQSPVDSDQSTAIYGWTLHDGEMYVSVRDPGGSSPDQRGRVFHISHKTGALTQIGQGFSSQTGDIAGGFPINLCSFMGQLFVALEGISGTSTRRIYRIRPFKETTWTLDLESANEGYAQSMAVFKGNLYIACGETDADGPEIMKRTPAGAYSQVESETGGGTHGVRFYSNLFVFNGALYAHYFQSTSVSKIVTSTDGASWSDDFDVAGELGTATWLPGSFLVTPGSAAVLATVISNGATGDGHILRKAAGGSWASVFGPANVTGYLGKVEVDE